MTRYFIFLIILMLFSSCRENDLANEKEKVLEQFTVNIDVNTNVMYEDFVGMSDSIVSEVAKNPNIFIGNITLLYDSEGTLIDSLNTYSKSLGIMRHSFMNVTEGNYNVVSIEMVVDGGNDYDSPYWSLSDIEKLSTARIVEKQSGLPSHAVVGIAHANIQLNDNTSVTISPEAIGSIIHTTWEGFGRSDFDLIAFYQKAAISHYKLDPTLTATKRYGIEDYKGGNTWEYVGYSEYLNNRVNSWFVLPQDEQKYIWGYIKNEELLMSNMTATYPQEAEDQDFSIKSGNSYYAHCRYNIETGGDTFIGDVNEYKGWLESLTPLPFHYKEPFWKLDADLSTVLEGMSKFEGQTTPADQDGYFFITYYDICSAERLEYWFLSESGGLYLANVYFNKEKVTKNEIEGFIKELGYFPWRYSPNGCYYLSNDERTRLFFTERGSEWLLQYY